MWQTGFMYLLLAAQVLCWGCQCVAVAIFFLCDTCISFCVKFYSSAFFATPSRFVLLLAMGKWFVLQSLSGKKCCAVLSVASSVSSRKKITPPNLQGPIPWILFCSCTIVNSVCTAGQMLRLYQQNSLTAFPVVVNCPLFEHMEFFFLGWKELHCSVMMQ